ncbi:MAG: hypothetical protein AAF578_13705 [Pseudomonadota bacterium]
MATERPLQVSYINREITGEFVERFGERFYAIENVDRMAPFFVSVVSHDNHWLFASSNGGLTAGRVSAETALFPYVTVDKIHDSATHTGCLTLMQIERNGEHTEWQPFDPSRHPNAPIRRTLYKSVAGNTLCFEESHLELGLTFRYRWRFSSQFGFVRDCELENNDERNYTVRLLDGLRNLLPAGAPRFAQTNTSNLVDAYKWSELKTETQLGLFSLYSAITDRAEPAESLRANTVFLQGLDDATVHLTDDIVDVFRAGDTPAQRVRARGQRGCFLAISEIALDGGDARRWRMVAEIEQDQSAVSELNTRLASDTSLSDVIEQDIAEGTDALLKLLAGADALQSTAEEIVSVHHYANVLFNVLRGGTFDHHYRVQTRDFLRSIALFDCNLAAQHREWLEQLPGEMHMPALLNAVVTQGDLQLERLCREYLPIRFGRRHGDPSRPWNQFAIELYDDDGDRLLAYQGNWRDIFQNWEALAISYPDFIENMIAKFVNASTADGYNPYRITNEGIDWEVEEPDDPWSYIGYWGDHQIIYLQKLLEWSTRFHPERIGDLLERPVFCYANVPYRLRSFDKMLADPKNTIDFDETLAEDIDRRVSERGADGKLLLADDGGVYRVNLVEKLLVPLLAKLSNLVVDGGVWMNTQRPEWNDANNALVGQGVSMVTMNYLRRYTRFLTRLIPTNTQYAISVEVADWVEETAAALDSVAAIVDGQNPVSDSQRFELLEQLGRPACRFRSEVYRQEGFTGTRSVESDEIHRLLSGALVAIEHSITTSRRDDQMFEAYNSIDIREGSIGVRSLYPMLEGQVAALSSQFIDSREVVAVLDALFASAVYRENQDSFMLYPDRELPGLLERNVLPAERVMGIGLLQTMLEAGDHRIVVPDVSGDFRFNAELFNAGVLAAQLSELAVQFPDAVGQDRDAIHGLYEDTFDHQSFTGRSGTMFGFEGLGSIYWHMVAKLLVAVQESYFDASAAGDNSSTVSALARHYYRIRDGLGFNKSPESYGAFPADPYSHTPGHAGAQQPGMTGQVKEEILTRFGELGIHLEKGALRLDPSLLRRQEFRPEPDSYRYVDVAGNWQTLPLPADSLAFSWCQIPFIYELAEGEEPAITIYYSSGEQVTIQGLKLSPEETRNITARDGTVSNIRIGLNPEALLRTED